MAVLPVRVINTAPKVVQQLHYMAMKPEQLQAVNGIISAIDGFAIFADWLWQEPVLHVSAVLNQVVLLMKLCLFIDFVTS